MKKRYPKTVFIFICTAIFLTYAISATCSTQIFSEWALTPPVIDGVIAPGEWNNATQIRLTHGRLLVQNDGTNLYLLVDVFGDKTNDNNPADTVLVVVDIDADKTIVPSVDTVYYGLSYLPTYMWYGYYDTPVHWVTGETTTSQLGGGFGSSGILWNHRFWEMALDLSELKVDTNQRLINPGDLSSQVRFGLEIQNQTPSWLDGEPDPNVEVNFSDLFEVFLKPTPSYSGGLIFKGVGLIPSTKIVDGYATTDPGYYFQVEDAPFGGTMHIFGDFADLRTRGAVYYQVLYSKNGGPFEVLTQTWTNYLWIATIGEFKLMKIEPDKGGRYKLPPAFQKWYLSDLLMTWNSRPFGNGLYRLKLRALRADNTEILLPVASNLLMLVIDNTPPQVSIDNIFHAGIPVDYCAVVDTPPNEFTFEISATDNEKHLRRYRLAAYWGDNESHVIWNENYTDHKNEDGLHLWDGDLNRILPDGSIWSAPVPCAYQFRLSGWGRSINGYTHLHYVEYTKHIAILLSTP